MLSTLFLLAFCLVSINGHGYLLDPVGRSTAWLVDPSFKQCCTYTDHMGMYCGGLQHQWRTNGGKCGICGEAYDKPNKLFEKGGAMYTGRIVKTYRKGEQIDVTVVLTANHRGYFEFRLCNVDSNPNSDATQECLDRRVLTIAGTGSTRLSDVGRYGTGQVKVRVQLPADISCRHCVFQWKYTAGNNWGTNPITGESGLGMGVENETFMGCSDIAILGDGTSVVTDPPVIQPTNPPSTTRRRTDPPPVTTSSARPPTGTTTWSANNVQYKIGDTVIYDGVKFICVHDHTSFPGAQPGILTWALWKRQD